MMRKRVFYLAVLSSIVFVYAALFNFMKKPDIVEAQNCFQVTMSSCLGAGCLPPCPNGFLAPDIVNSGYSPGIYGVPMNASVCMNFSGGSPCSGITVPCLIPGNCCSGVCVGAGVAGGRLCCGAGQVGLCAGGTNALGCCATGTDCPGGTCTP